MAATSVNRARYREYTQYLRVRADQLDMAVAPARLEQLRAKVNSERNAFVAWVAVWLLIALACLLPFLMVLAFHFSWPIPQLVAGQADMLYSQLDALNSAAANMVVIVLGAMFVGAVVIGYTPVIAHSAALNDLEYAHRALREVERG
jgi:hypothetical protein